MVGPCVEAFYLPRTVDLSILILDDLSILILENLLTLANIIITSGIPHHCPYCLGVFTSVQVTMLYL